MTAALMMPDRPECPAAGGGESAGVWISPTALAQLFSFHVIKDLNFLSQVIKLSVTETLQPGILTKVQLKCQEGQTESVGLAVGAAECLNMNMNNNLEGQSGLVENNDGDADPEMMANQVKQKNATNMKMPNSVDHIDHEMKGDAIAVEDWDAELSHEAPRPPPLCHVAWGDNPRMRKIYKYKCEDALARQRELEEMRSSVNQSPRDDQQSQDDQDNNGNFSPVPAIDRTKQLNMNKLVKKGRKLFVRNINYKTSQHKLWEFFKKFGRVRSCDLLKDRYSRRSRGLAFVTFDKLEECDKVLSASEEELTLQGWVLQVELARPKKIEPTDNDNGNQTETIPCEESEDKPSEPQLNTPAESEPSSCDVLTDDAFLHIFSYLDIRQLTACERVCKRWHGLARQTWKEKTSVSLYGLVEGFQSVDDRSFRSMLSKCSSCLTSLDLSVSSRSLTDRSLDAIARYCPNVQNIQLNSLQITNRGFENFVKKCTQIQRIKIEHCTDVREDGIWRLFNSCRNLKEVHLNDFKRISGQCFHVMAGNLVTLSLNGCLKLQDVALTKLSMRCENLLELHLSGCNLLTDAGLKSLAQNEVVNTLQILSLDSCFPHISSEGLQQIAEFRNLRELHLSENNRVTDEILQKICETCASLRVLDIGGCGGQITDDGLKKFPISMEELNISYLSSITDEGLEIVADHCPKLAVLKARFCLDVSDAGLLSVIINCNHLRELDVCGSFNVTNNIINALIEEQKMRETPLEKIYVIAGGTGVVASELSLPPSLTLNTFAFNPTVPDYDPVPFAAFDSEEEDSYDEQDDDFDDFLNADDPMLEWERNYPS